jgi:ketosteroid isomerase-like protein
MGDETPYFEVVGRGFIEQYYAIFGSDRSQCAGIYRDNTLMTYAGQQMQGVTAIMEYFRDVMTLGTCQYLPLDIDCHPTASGGVLVVVNGEVKIDGENHSLMYNDTFYLSQDEQGNYYVANQISRILGGGSH